MGKPEWSAYRRVALDGGWWWGVRTVPQQPKVPAFQRREEMSDAKQLLEEITRGILDGDVDLNEWETEFVESIGRQVAAGRELSDKQDEILERIWRKVTA
jgi:hypothetical protein